MQDCPNDSKTVQALLGSLHYLTGALFGRSSLDFGRWRALLAALSLRRGAAVFGLLVGAGIGPWLGG